MALVKCPDCGNTFNDAIKLCPYCGCPITKMSPIKQNGFGIASLILGIISIVTVWMVIGIIPAVIGTIFAIIALLHKNTKKGNAIAGLSCSLISITIFITIVIVVNGSAATNTHAEHKIVAEVEESTPEPQIPTPAPTPTKSPKELEQEYKDSCKEYKYKDVLRNPNDYIGERVKVTVKINTVVEESWINDCKYYFAYSNDEYDWWSGDEYVVWDKREEEKPKLLEEDIIIVYGEIADTEHTVSLITSGSEVFAIDMKYIDFISE